MSTAYDLMVAAEAEISMEDGLSRAFKNDKFHNVTLVANDGEHVQANRVLLAARSKVFESMLMGSFSEASKPEIEVSYPGEVTKAVVEYIHTNKTNLLSNLCPAKRGGLGDISEAGREEFQTLVTLTGAAAYYNLPQLCHSTNTCMEAYLKRFPSLSFAVIKACAQTGPAISKDMLEMALSNIRENRFEKLNQQVLCGLSAGELALVLRDEKARVPEYKRFEMVHQWSKGGLDGQMEDRLASAKQLVKDHLKLHYVEPDVLATTVTSSGLVGIEQLAESYKHQAIDAHCAYSVSFQRKPIVCNPVWVGSNSNSFSAATGSWTSDKLNCPPLTAGRKYQWIIKATSELVMIGVVTSNVLFHPNKACGYHQGGWGIEGSNGDLRYGYPHDGREQRLGESARFGDGSHIRVTLDLSPDEKKHGSMSICVDGVSSVFLCGNMKGRVANDAGFVPAVSCRNGGGAEIISIEEFL